MAGRLEFRRVASALGHHPVLIFSAGVVAAMSGWVGSQVKRSFTAVDNEATAVGGMIVFDLWLFALAVAIVSLAVAKPAPRARLARTSAILLAAGVGGLAVGYQAGPVYHPDRSGPVILTVSTPSAYRWEGVGRCIPQQNGDVIDEIRASLTRTDAAPAVWVRLYDGLRSVEVWLDPQPKTGVSAYREHPWNYATGRAKVTLELANDLLSGRLHFEGLPSDSGFLLPADRPIAGTVEWHCAAHGTVRRLDAADDRRSPASPADTPDAVLGQPGAAFLRPTQVANGARGSTPPRPSRTSARLAVGHE